METRLRPDAACATLTPPAEALIGVTLALLTLYARSPNLEAADQIACNLALLARHEQVAQPLQTICSRLFVEWLGPLQLQDVGPDHHWKDVHDPPAVTQ